MVARKRAAAGWRARVRFRCVPGARSTRLTTQHPKRPSIHTDTMRLQLTVPPPCAVAALHRALAAQPDRLLPITTGGRMKSMFVRSASAMMLVFVAAGAPIGAQQDTAPAA